MPVELIVFDMEQKTVLSFIPSCNLKTISRTIPKISSAEPITIETFRYFVGSKSFLITWDNIKNKPKRPKNMMSFPFEDPIRNMYVIGRIIGFKISVTNITPASNMNRNPIMIVLLIFIKNNLIVNALNN